MDLQIIISMLMKLLNLKLFVSVSGSCRETIKTESVASAVLSWRTKDLEVPPAVLSPQDVPELHQLMKKVIRCTYPP